MSQLHKALESLRPKDFAEVPTDDLNTFLTDLFSKAELIANSVPHPPNGTPYELSKRSRSEATGATSSANLTASTVRRPAPSKEQAELQKSWGKPLRLGAKDAATGINVFKMAGTDRHGAWFARTSVHEGLGFAKWKKAMMKEFPESLEVQGGPGVGNVRGIGGDQRLEDIKVDGVGKLEVYQLSAQFPGPTAPREFITLLLTSDNCLTGNSKVGDVIPRHFMVVSIPVSHPDAPPRNGMVRGSYESVEIIREIPLASSRAVSASTSDLLKHDRKKSRERGGTIGFAESRGPDAKGEKIDRADDADDDDPETNPVEWLMITRSDPGGGIPRFMVERGTPSSIVQDAGKFVDWACAMDDIPEGDEAEQIAQDVRPSIDAERFSIGTSNGIMAGVGTSIADRPDPATFRRPSQRTVDKDEEKPGIIQSVVDTLDPHLPTSLQRTDSHSSSTSSASIDSFASAEQFSSAHQSLAIDDTLSPSAEDALPQDQNSRELQKIETKRLELKSRLDLARQKQTQEEQDASSKSAKELEKAADKHDKERKKQEEKFAKEVQKLEARRERETQKLLARQQKETDKTLLQKTQRERDDWKRRALLGEQQNKLLLEQVKDLQRENTTLVAKFGKFEGGRDMLKSVRDRAGSGGSSESSRSKRSGAKEKDGQVETSALANAQNGEG